MPCVRVAVSQASLRCFVVFKPSISYGACERHRGLCRHRVDSPSQPHSLRCSVYTARTVYNMKHPVDRPRLLFSRCNSLAAITYTCCECSVCLYRTAAGFIRTVRCWRCRCEVMTSSRRTASVCVCVCVSASQCQSVSTTPPVNLVMASLISVVITHRLYVCIPQLTVVVIGLDEGITDRV